MNDIEDWVLLEAAKRCDWPFDADANDGGVRELRDNYGRGSITEYRVFRALCDMIAKHEQPPADPDEEADPDVAAVVRIWGAIYGIYDIKPGFLRPSHALARAVSQYKQEKANG